jgi:ABC-type glycerol-3-phosphate transport system substrate-binding protein
MNQKSVNISRRNFLKLAGMGAAGLTMGNFLVSCTPKETGPVTLNVLTPAAPDPAPPGVAAFSEEAFAQWQTDHNAKVVYESPPWPQLHDKMAANFASGQYVHDVMYNWHQYQSLLLIWSISSTSCRQI